MVTVETNHICEVSNSDVSFSVYVDIFSAQATMDNLPLTHVVNDGDELSEDLASLSLVKTTAGTYVVEEFDAILRDIFKDECRLLVQFERLNELDDIWMPADLRDEARFNYMPMPTEIKWRTLRIFIS